MDKKGQVHFGLGRAYIETEKGLEPVVPSSILGIAQKLGLTGAEVEERADVEDPRPEPRSAVPELVRGGVFPIKARIVKLLAFENTPPAEGDDPSVPGGTADPTSELPYSGKLTNTLNINTGELAAIGLAQQVNEWLLVAEEIDMLDWELSQDAITGYPRFLILYTE